MGAATQDDFQTFLSTVNSPGLRAIAHHWDQVRREKPMPTWADLSSSDLSPHFKMIWGFKYDPGAEDFTGMLAGTNVRDWLGANFWGASLKDLHPPAVFRDAHQFLSKVVAIPAAGRCHGRLFTIGENAVRGERIALPLASNGINGDAVLGASDYEGPVVMGPVALIHENMEWFAI